MDIVILEPAGKTVDRKPVIRWKSNFSQDGYAVAIFSPNNTSRVYYAVDDTTSNRLSNEHLALFSPTSESQYTVALSVKGGDGNWYPKQFFVQHANRPSGNEPTISIILTQTQNINIAVGDMVFIKNVGTYFDGIFPVRSVFTGGFTYKYLYGSYTNSLAASSSTGIVAKCIKYNFTYYDAVEHWIDIFQVRNTRSSEGFGVIPSTTDGVVTSKNFATIKSQIGHYLKKGDYIFLETPYNDLNKTGIVKNIIDDTTFVADFYSTFPSESYTLGGNFYDFGIEDYYSVQDMEEDNVRGGLSILSLGSRYFPSGSITLRRDSGVVNTSWGFMSYDAIKPGGTSISVKARAFDSPENLSNDTGWVDNLDSGSILNLSGRYLELVITLSTTNPQITPVLNSVHIAYQVHASEEDLSKQYTWSNFQAGEPGVVYLDNTAPMFRGGSWVAALAPDRVENRYVSSGHFYVFQDSGGLSTTWSNMVFDVHLPSVVAQTQCHLKVSTRVYNKLSERKTASWSSPVTISTSGNAVLHNLENHIGRYFEAKIELVSSSDFTTTPVLRSLKISWEHKTDPNVSYFYTTLLTFQDRVDSIIIAGDADNIDATEITYGVNFTGNFSSFDSDFEIVPANEYYKFQGERWNKIIVGVKLYTGNKNAKAVLRGFAFQIATETGVSEMLNYNM